MMTLEEAVDTESCEPHESEASDDNREASAVSSARKPCPGLDEHSNLKRALFSRDHSRNTEANPSVELEFSSDLRLPVMRPAIPSTGLTSASSV